MPKYLVCMHLMKESIKVEGKSFKGLACVTKLKLKDDRITCSVNLGNNIKNSPMIKLGLLN